MPEFEIRVNKPTKRRHKRVELLLLLDIFGLGIPRKRDRGVITNISKSGAGFSSNTRFDMDEEIKLRFILPKGKVYEFNGTVRRIDKKSGVFDYGIEFHNLDFFKKLQIKKIISVFKKSR